MNNGGLYMFTRRNRVSLLLIVTLCVALILTACGGNSNSAPNSTTTNSANTSSGNTSTPPASEPVKEPINVTVMRGDSPLQPIVKDAPALLEILKNTNVKINIEGVPNSDYTAKKNTMIATNNLPDIMHVSRGDITTYASTGAFLNISEYMDEYAPNMKKRIEADPEAYKLTIDGDFYGFPIMARKSVAANVGGMPMIRTDILAELNLEVPTTFDELYEVLKAFKQAYPDSYPWSIRNGSQYNLRLLAYAFGGGFSIYYEPNEDKFVYGPTRESFKDVITYMNKLYVDKILEPNFANLTVQQWQENLSSGKSMFFYDNYTFATNFNMVLQEVNPDAQFDMLPIMADNEGNRRNYMDNPSSFNSYVVSSKVKNPEEIVKMFDWMYTDEGADVTNFGIPGEHFTRSGDQVTISQSLIDQFKDKQDPYRAMQSYTGTGLLGFSVFTDDTPMLTISPPQLQEWSDMVKVQKEQGIIIEKPLDPPFTEEEREKLTQLNTKVNTILDQNIDKFIFGARALSELDQFAKELIDNGADEIEAIYNTAWERMK